MPPGDDARGPASAAGIRLLFQELQVLFRDKKAAEHFVAAPLEKERLAGERPRRRFHSGKRYFYNASDRCAKRLRQAVDILWAEPCAARVGAWRQQREVQAITRWCWR